MSAEDGNPDATTAGLAFRGLTALTADAATNTLTVGGLRRLLDEADAPGLDEIEAVLDPMFELMDRDGDGVVTEGEFVSASTIEPKLVPFAETVVERCVARSPEKAADVERARSRSGSPDGGAAAHGHGAIPYGNDGGRGEGAQGNRGSTIDEEAEADGESASEDERPRAGEREEGEGGRGGVPRIGVLRGMTAAAAGTADPREREDHDEFVVVTHGPDPAAEAAARLAATVERLESQLKAKTCELLHAQHRARDIQESNERAFADFEEQLGHRDTVITSLKRHNSDLSEKVGVLERTGGGGDGGRGTGGSTVGAARTPRGPSPKSPEMDLLSKQLGEVSDERDALRHEVEALVAEKEALAQEMEAAKKLALSKRKVSESALQALEEENVALREQQMEIEVVRAQNARLRDELDEATSQPEPPGRTASTHDDEGDDDGGAAGGAVSGDLQLAFDLLQAEVKELRAEAAGARELRRRLAQSDTQESIKGKRLEALEQELAVKTADNAALGSQVEALGLALDQMKALLDASGAAVSKVSAKRMGGTPKGKGLMQKLGASFSRRARSTPPGGARGGQSPSGDDAMAHAIDAIPETPVSMCVSPVDDAQVLSDIPSIVASPEPPASASAPAAAASTPTARASGLLPKLLGGGKSGKTSPSPTKRGASPKPPKKGATPKPLPHSPSKEAAKEAAATAAVAAATPGGRGGDAISAGGKGAGADTVGRSGSIPEDGPAEAAAGVHPPPASRPATAPGHRRQESASSFADVSLD